MPAGGPGCGWKLFRARSAPPGTGHGRREGARARAQPGEAPGDGGPQWPPSPLVAAVTGGRPAWPAPGGPRDRPSTPDSDICPAPAQGACLSTPTRCSSPPMTTRGRGHSRTQPTTRSAVVFVLGEDEHGCAPDRGRPERRWPYPFDTARGNCSATPAKTGPAHQRRDDGQRKGPQGRGGDPGRPCCGSGRSCRSASMAGCLAAWGTPRRAEGPGAGPPALRDTLETHRRPGRPAVTRWRWVTPFTR